MAAVLLPEGKNIPYTIGAGVQTLVDVWEHFEVEQVYRADSLGVMRSGARWLSILSFGWILRQWHSNPPNVLLDNSPLISLLHRMLDLPRLDAALSGGSLHALAVTASSYTAGQHLTFYQCAADIEPWSRTQRIALRDQIGVDHLLASERPKPVVRRWRPIYYFSPASPVNGLVSGRGILLRSVKTCWIFLP